jgi:hypothetical protein
VDRVQERAERVAFDLQVVPGLKIDPELSRRTEVPSEPKSGIGGDATLSVDDLIDSPRRHVDIDGDTVLRDPQRSNEVLEENFARMNRRDLGHVFYSSLLVRTLVVVDDLDTCGPHRGPREAHSPLIVDADAVLANPITFQRFKSIAGRNPHIVEDDGCIENRQLSERHADDSGIQRSNHLPTPQPLGVLIPERLDHRTNV